MIHTLLTELRLALLYRGDEHVTGRGRRETVERRTGTEDGNDVQVLGTRVVSAVHDGADRKTERHAVLVTNGNLAHGVC